jgi:hypothetical protein
MTGELVINRSSSHLQLQESAVNKWHMESVGGQLRFVETGIAQRLVLNTGNTGQMTWNGNTVWHAGNMGSGSGLDADKVDGIDSTTLRQGRNANYLNFTVNGDANTYYPVLVGGSAKYGFNTYSITRAYNWTAPSTWGQADGSHLGGLTFTFQWSGDTGWGGNDHNLRVVQFYETYTNMVGGFKLSTGGLIVYLRGGGAQYQLQTESGTSSTVTIYDGVSNASTSYTAPDSTVYAPRTDTSNVNSEVNAFFPVRNGGTLYVSNNVVWHSGNMGSGSHLDSDTVDGIQGSQFLRNDLSSQSVNTGFTMSANAYVGMSNSSGALYVRTGTGSLGIQLAGDNASQQAGVKVYMNASGNANFGGTVSANALVISSTSLVNNLNAQMLNGVKEPQIVKNQSIADISGKGVYAGCGVTAQAVPNMTAQVIAGTVYTDSGMRVSIGSSYNVSFSAPSATYNRIDSVYVQGSSAGANEGVVTVAQGTASATPVPPSIPSDGVLLANVTIRQNAGSILGTDITDMRMWKNLFNLNGDTYINNNLYVQSQLNSTLGYINMLKPIKNTPSNNSITISAGSTSYTWTHNLGLTNYIVKLSTNNPEPHIYWSNKTTNAITINLDDSYDTDTIVDIGIEAF